MRSLSRLFGRSPFEHLVEHARKVHECVALIQPVAKAILANDMPRLRDLQHDISRTEYEADQLKDHVRQQLPRRFFLPVSREDVARFLSDMDKIADGAEDFAVVATFRELKLPEELHADFLALTEKVVQVSEALLGLAEHLSQLQKATFTGPEAEDALMKIQEVAHMEWESDKLSRSLARHYYCLDELPPVTVLILEKLSEALARIADHAENVGKNLRLMILRK